ncbi:ABC transporter permease [Pseudochelatococcus sp. B33]
MKKRISPPRAAFYAAVILTYLFLLSPIVLVFILSFNAGELLAFPPTGLSLRWYIAAFSSEQFRNAFITSVKLAGVSVLVSGLLGTMAAIYYVRYAKYARGTTKFLLLSPLILPEVLTAIALLIFLYSTGFRPGYVSLQIGHILITLPYVFINVVAALSNFDVSTEQAARGLGASPLVTFYRVTLPLIKPGIISGCLFTFVISFDLFNTSLLLKGAGLNTLPLQLYDYLTWDLDPTAAAVSGVSIAVTTVCLIALERTVGLRSLRF